MKPHPFIVLSTATIALLTTVLGASPASANVPDPGFAPVPRAAKSVLMIGDSIMEGLRLPASDAWPMLLGARNGWNVTNLACSGAGFVQIGAPDDCNSTFSGVIGDAVLLTPDVVIVEGSSNDFGQDNDQLRSSTSDTIRDIRSEFPNAQIIGLSTVWGDTLPPDQLSDTNSQVADAIRDVGGTFLDIGQPLADQPDLMQSDDVHPTTAGQVVLAQAIEQAVADDATTSALAGTGPISANQPQQTDPPSADPWPTFNSPFIF